MSRRNLPCSNKILWKTCSFSLFLVTIWNFLSMMRIESRALRILQSRSYQMVLHFYHFFFASGLFSLLLWNVLHFFKKKWKSVYRYRSHHFGQFRIMFYVSLHCTKQTVIIVIKFSYSRICTLTHMHITPY